MIGQSLDDAMYMGSEESLSALLSQVLNASLDGIMAFRSLRDERGRIVDFEWIVTNDRACEIVGLTREQLLGSRLLEVMPGNKDEGLFDQYVQVVETGEPVRLEFFYDHDGLRE
jgi:PAS domain S-box-containing protein